MSTDTKIEWTETTSGGEKLRYGTILNPALSPETIQVGRDQPVNPENRISVLLSAVARLARRHQVAGHSATAHAHGNEMIERGRWCRTISAAERQHVLAPPSGDSTHSPPRPPAPSCRCSGVVQALSRPCTWLAPTRSDRCYRKPLPAATTPGKTLCSLDATLRDPWAAGRLTASAHETRGCHAVRARCVHSEAAERVPGTTAKAPLLTRGTPPSVFIDGHPDSLSGGRLDSLSTSHAFIFPERHDK